MQSFRLAAFQWMFLIFLLYSSVALAQDGPGRFEIGGSFTGVRNRSFSSEIGFGPEADFNFGRHFALDAAINWLPSNIGSGNTVIGLFGAKVGKRTEHFGFFGKARPGFITVDSVLRGSTIDLSSPAPFFRFGRLTQPALDLGGVVEYYPAKHWALRWDLGDTLLFEENGPVINVIALPGTPPVNVLPPFPGQTTNQFQFSTGVHYRF